MGCVRAKTLLQRRASAEFCNKFLKCARRPLEADDCRRLRVSFSRPNASSTALFRSRSDLCFCCLVPRRGLATHPCNQIPLCSGASLQLPPNCYFLADRRQICSYLFLRRGAATARASIASILRYSLQPPFWCLFWVALLLWQPCGSTLIICPHKIRSQWEMEIRARTKAGALKVCRLYVSMRRVGRKFEVYRLDCSQRGCRVF